MPRKKNTSPPNVSPPNESRYQRRYPSVQVMWYDDQYLEDLYLANQSIGAARLKGLFPDLFTALIPGMRHEDQYLAAKQAIDALAGHLPDNDAADQLNRLLDETAAALFTYLDHPATKHLGNDDGQTFRRCNFERLARSAVEIANALLKFAHAHSDSIQSLLEWASEWPAVISLDPSKDIRRVNRNPKGAAAKHYKPILKNFGKQDPFNSSVVREPGVFHEIAKQAVDVITTLASEAGCSGLPRLLDFNDGRNDHVLSSSEPTLEGKREWTITLKYFLYLTLAPERTRKQLRDAWRLIRVRAFAQFKPKKAAGRKYHRELQKRNPLPSPRGTSGPADRMIHPPFLDAEEYYPIPPMWVQWWEATLRYDPAALFGNLAPLVDWPHPAVAKIVTAKSVSGRPLTAFGRCVDAVLDAFLHMLGVTGGLKDVENATNPLPRITPNEMIPGSD